MNRSTLQFLLFLLLVIGLVFLEKILGFDFTSLKVWLSHFPLWLSGLLYIFIYVGVTTFFWFGTLDFFRISGALLFGPYWSTLFVYLAEIGNAAILFQLSRKLGRECVIKTFHLKSSDTPTVKDNAGLWTALAMRVNMLIPFRFMDVGFGLSKLSLSKYVWAVVLGSPLRIFVMQFIIAGMGELFLKNPMAMVDFLKSNPLAMKICNVYMISVIIVTVVAVVVNWLKKLSRKS